MAHNCITTSISVPSNLLEHFPPFSNNVDPFFPIITLSFPILSKWPKTLNKHLIWSKNLPRHLFELLNSFYAWDNIP